MKNLTATTTETTTETTTTETTIEVETLATTATETEEETEEETALKLAADFDLFFTDAQISEILSNYDISDLDEVFTILNDNNITPDNFIRNEYDVSDITGNDICFHNGDFFDEDYYKIDIDGDIISIDVAVYSEEEGEYIHENDAVRCYIGRYEQYCSERYAERHLHEYNGDYYDNDALCYNYLVITEDNGIMSENNAYCHEDGGWYSYEEEEYIRSYHNGGHKKNDLGVLDAKYFVGFEIEKEDISVRESMYINDFENECPNWRKEEDGSLDSRSGFELVSPTMPLNIEAIEEYINDNETLVNHINAEYSDACGGHINFSIVDMTSEAQFDAIAGYMPLLYALYPNRIGKDYCKAKNTNQLKSDNEKYQAVQLKNGFIEFRIFPAVQSVKNLLWRAKLVKCMAENPTNNAKEAFYNIHTAFNPLFVELYEENYESKFANLCERFIMYSKTYADEIITHETAAAAAAAK